MSNPSTQPPGPLAKAVALIVLALLLVLGFMFSLVLLAVVPVIALVAGGWFWWKAEQIRAAEALSEQFSAALEKAESGSTTEAVEAFFSRYDRAADELGVQK